jgi:hypothetical protein
MQGRCSVCKQDIPLITIKEGSLFDSDLPYEVCYEHKGTKGIFKESCNGGYKKPEVVYKS